MGVTKLMMIDCKRAVPLLIQNRDLISPPEVVKQLLNGKNRDDFRYSLHLYLHSLFEVNPHVGKDFQDKQVEPHADYDSKMLLPFLHSSQHYTLEKAYEICTKRDLLREQVFILGRMGNSKQALAVVINNLGDIEEVGMLLEHTVGNLDLLYIVNKVPNGLEVHRLRDRLVKIITDSKTETSLRHISYDMLLLKYADWVNLLVKYYKEARHGINLSNEEDEPRHKRSDIHASQGIEKSPILRTIELKSKTSGGGRVCFVHVLILSLYRMCQSLFSFAVMHITQLVLWIPPTLVIPTKKAVPKR